MVWLRAGLLVLENNRLARVSESGVAVWEDDELLVKPKSAPEPAQRTYSQAVDAAYIFAHDGQVRVSREQRNAFAHWRQRWGIEEAERMIREYLSREREFAMREQYGWL